MKTVFLAAAIAITFVSGAANAACTGTRLNHTQILNTSNFGGNTVCVGTSQNWQGQEYHLNGKIIDFKKGPNDPKDKSKEIGTYTIVGTGANATIKYDYYNAGGSFTYSVFKDGTTYNFCDSAGTVFKVTATVKPNGNGCD